MLRLQTGWEDDGQSRSRRKNLSSLQTNFNLKKNTVDKCAMGEYFSGTQQIPTDP